MKMKQSVVAGILLGASVALYQVGASASGSSVPKPSSSDASMPMRTPEEMAIAAYNSGVDHKDKGLKIEATASASSEAKERAKVADKAKKEYEKALKDFKSAAAGSPQMYQAYNGMGFAYRKTGDYAKALEMYDRALTLKPGFPDAIEYRGEAYLGLNRIDDAKQAYLEILAADRKQADTLMAAMQKWIEQKKATSGGVDPAVVSGLETWLKERAEIAKDTMAMGMSHGPRW
jgi:tetratricopeptide (TPR) repeat protein